MSEYNSCPFCNTKIHIQSSIKLELNCNQCGNYTISLPLFIRCHEDMAIKNKLRFLSTDIQTYNNLNNGKPFQIDESIIKSMNPTHSSKKILYTFVLNIFLNSDHINQKIDNFKYSWCYSKTNEDFFENLRTLHSFGIVDFEEVENGNGTSIFMWLRLNPHVYLLFEDSEYSEDKFFQAFIIRSNTMERNIVIGDGNIVGSGNSNNTISITNEKISLDKVLDSMKEIGFDKDTIELIKDDIAEICSVITNEKENKLKLTEIISNIGAKAGKLVFPLLKQVFNNFNEIVSTIDMLIKQT